MIGMFLRPAAETAYRQVEFRRALEDETKVRLLNPLPVTVTPPSSSQESVETYVYRNQFKMSGHGVR